MSYKFVGPVGKQFRGDKQRAMLLMGSARLLAQRGLDKIEARGGAGFQLERQILGDSSTVEAWVNKLAGQPAQVRVKIWCPELEEFCVPQLIDASRDDALVQRYITWGGLDKVFNPAYGLPRSHWVGKRGAQPIVLIDSFDKLYVGDTVIAVPEYVTKGICIKRFGGKEYTLFARQRRIDVDHDEAWIYANEIKEDGSLPDSQLIWKINLPTPITGYVYHDYSFIFSASSTKVVCICRQVYGIDVVSETLLPDIFPDLDDEGVPIPVSLSTLVKYTQVPYTEPVVTDETIAIPTPSNPYQNLSETVLDWASYTEDSSQQTVTSSMNRTVCLGAYYNEDLLEMVTEEERYEETKIITNVSWVYNAYEAVNVPQGIILEVLDSYLVKNRDNVSLGPAAEFYSRTETITHKWEFERSTGEKVTVQEGTVASTASTEVNADLLTGTIAKVRSQDWEGNMPFPADPRDIVTPAASAVINTTEINTTFTYYARCVTTSNFGRMTCVIGPTWTGEGTGELGVEDLSEPEGLSKVYHYGVLLYEVDPQVGLVPDTLGNAPGAYEPETINSSDIKWFPWIKGKIPPDAVALQNTVWIPDRKVADGYMDLWPATTCWPKNKPLI